MEDNNEIIRAKKKIKDKLISKELTDIIVGLIAFIILSCIFGYIGYKFCLENGYDVQRGIVFCILFPMGIAILKESNFGSKITYIAYTILYFILLNYIPTYIGIALLCLIILLFIGIFISVLKKDRSEEIDKIYRQEYCNSTKKPKFKGSADYKKTIIDKSEDSNFPEEKYYCERCFKEISQEEYELYDDMCEECFEETHYDFDGNPREDYWNY